MRGFAAPALALTAAACAAGDPMDRRPPSTASVLEALAAEPACGANWHVEPRDETPPGAPALVRRCAPVYPETLRKAGLEAECVAHFVLSPEGQPTDVTSECVVWNAYGRHEAAWRELAAAVFAASATRSVAGYQTAPVGAEWLERVGDRAAVRVVFELADEDDFVPSSVQGGGGVEE
jgi:hypothetical protein